MLSAISKYMPRWLMGIIATALVLATVVGSNQDSAEAIDPADTDTVYIADGTNFADALMGATIASLNTSPMLGVAGTNSGDVIPGDTEEELDRLTNDRASPLDTIYIFGGTSAVSTDVENQLGQWANDVQRIEGDSRWGTYQAISEMLPSAVDEAVHAQEADNADTLDGSDSTDFLGANDQAADSELLDGMDSSDFLGSGEQAVDSDKLDGADLLEAQFPDVVPEGVTLRGHFGFEGEAASAGDGFGAPVSFPVPLNSTPTAFYVADPSSPPADCPGTADQPEAAPGAICFYPSNTDNATFSSFFEESRFGGTLFYSADASGHTHDHGTWAVTAPATSSSSASSTTSGADSH